MDTNIKSFLDAFIQSLDDNTFVKCDLTNKREKTSDLKRIIIKKIKLKAGERLNFVYRHNTKDITKNYEKTEAIRIVEEQILKQFLQGNLFSISNNYHLNSSDQGKSTLNIKPPTLTTLPALDHNRQKNRIVKANKKYLTLLGVTNKSGKILKDKNSKFRQINKFIELLDHAIQSTTLEKNISVLDMGSGLGYLTFALYDYFVSKSINSTVTGIEMRKELVDKCNKIAQACDYKNLNFKEGTIENTDVNNENIVIALHACDTATDDAISKGIKGNADIIVCSPCCHKQIRKALQPDAAHLSLTQHGILKERQAEIITDTIRSLLLEAHGYKTKVMEFISSEHTSKNLLIIAVKSKKDLDTKSKYNDIDNLKEMFGIKEHYLEGLLAD